MESNVNISLKKHNSTPGLFSQILWPTVGGLTGFLLFFVFLAYGESAVATLLPEKAINIVGVAVATFVAAWAGGWAAFGAERRTQEINRMNSRISAANKAVFTIATAHTVFENIKEHFIDANDVRSDPQRALRMDSPQSGMLSNIEFDFDELGYFLDHAEDICAAALKELMEFEWQYRILFQSVEQRAKAWEDLHMAILANPIANLSDESIKTIYVLPYRRLDSATTQMIESVEDGLKSAQSVYLTMQKALKCQFPDQVFLQINFVSDTVP